METDPRNPLALSRSSPAPAARSGKRRALILLEAVLALALFFLSALLVGAAINSSLRSSMKLERRTRGLMLAEAVLARIDVGELVAAENSEGDFAPQFPDYHYRLDVEPVEQMDTVQAVTVTVFWPSAEGGSTGEEQVLKLTTWQFHPPEPEPTEEQPEESATSDTAGSSGDGTGGGSGGSSAGGGDDSGGSSGRNSGGTGGRQRGGRP